MKTQKDLTPQQKQLWLKAVSAMEIRNYAYVIQLAQQILQSLPDFLDGRKLARKAAFEKAKTTKKSFFSLGGMGGGTSKASGLLKKGDVAGALVALEEILAEDPGSIQANNLLRETALKWDPPMNELALYAFETILEANPKDKEQLNRFAAFCMEKDETGQPRDPARAVEIYDRILTVTPNDLAAIKGSKDASAAASVQKGGWENADSYRDLIKDKNEAVTLEQASRVVKSEEMIEDQIAQLSAAVQAEPGSIDKSRRVAELYEQKGELDQALEWYRYVLGLTAGADPTIARKISDLQLRQINEAYKAREDYLSAAPDDPEAPRYRQEMEELAKQRAEFILSEARERVDRNPTDLLAHFDLATALMDVDLYNLGVVYENMEKKADALDCFKQIYEVDYGYRDVATKVESSYGQS